MHLSGRAVLARRHACGLVDTEVVQKECRLCLCSAMLTLAAAVHGVAVANAARWLEPFSMELTLKRTAIRRPRVPLVIGALCILTPSVGELNAQRRAWWPGPWVETARVIDPEGTHLTNPQRLSL